MFLYKKVVEFFNKNKKKGKKIFEMKAVIFFKTALCLKFCKVAPRGLFEKKFLIFFSSFK